MGDPFWKGNSFVHAISPAFPVLAIRQGRGVDRTLYLPLTAAFTDAQPCSLWPTRKSRHYFLSLQGLVLATCLIYVPIRNSNSYPKSISFSIISCLSDGTCKTKFILFHVDQRPFLNWPLPTFPALSPASPQYSCPAPQPLSVAPW